MSDIPPSRRVRIVRLADRRHRGPADGLLAEIQAEVLARHPEWQERLDAILDAREDRRRAWWTPERRAEQAARARAAGWGPIPAHRKTS